MRGVIGAHPLANEVLAAAAEGHPAYDCKGFVCLFALGLVKAGADWADLKALSIPTGGGERHMVLQYREKVLDNTQSYLTAPGDYPGAGEIKMMCAILNIA